MSNWVQSTYLFREPPRRRPVPKLIVQPTLFVPPPSTPTGIHRLNAHAPTRAQYLKRR